MPFETQSARDLLRSFPEPALVIDHQGGILFANVAGERLLQPQGIEPGTSITAFLPEDERSRLRPLDWLKRWAESPDAPELRHVHLYCAAASGSTIPVRVRVGRLNLDPPCYMVMLQDVSEEQARQHETRQAQRLASRQLAISADAILNVDERLKITYANAATHTLFGYPAGSLVGKPLALLLPERFRADHDKYVHAFAAETSPARLMGERAEITGRHADGTELPLEASIAKITTDRGQVFTAHLRDLRERKAQEANLRRALSSLSTIFEHALQAMALINPDGTVEQMNAAARQLLPSGFNPQGQAFVALPFWSDDAQATRTNLTEALDSSMQGTPVRQAVGITMPEGTHRTLDFSLTPVLADGAVVAVVAEARDLLEDV